MKDPVQRRRPINPLNASTGGAALAVVFILLLIAAGILYYFRSVEAPAPKNAATASGHAKAGFTVPAARPAFDAPRELELAPTASAGGRAGAALATAAKAYNAGEYAKAGEILRAALKEEPDSAEVKDALARALNKDAITRYNAGRFAEARDILTEAVEVSKSDALVRNLANAQIRLDDYKGAAETLEPLSGDPMVRTELVNLYLRLANDAYKGNRMAEAADYYEKALALAPGDSDLRKAAVKVRAEAEAEARMTRTEVSHFTVKYEGGENAVAGHLIGLVLEEAYHKVGSDLDFYPDDRIEALLYSKEMFRDVTGSPSWAGALFDGRIKAPAGGVTEKTDLLEKVIFHEYTHAVIHRIGGERVPTWLHEGLAQYEEGKDDAPYRAQLKEFAAGVNNSPVLRRLEGSFMGMSGQDAQAAYILSLSATRYIIREFGIFSARRILEGLKEGKSIDAAVDSALFMSYDDLQKSWLDSLKNG
ncbi:MAG: tetratricopeptide repeat protein [Deltaproteobacteria bacterium]|nr:tetratricopeptide repeat protein [Deltaproteobacteria bacterium]